jgi:hypothetical protein
VAPAPAPATSVQTRIALYSGARSSFLTRFLRLSEGDTGHCSQCQQPNTRSDCQTDLLLLNTLLSSHENGLGSKGAEALPMLAVGARVRLAQVCRQSSGRGVGWVCEVDAVDARVTARAPQSGWLAGNQSGVMKGRTTQEQAKQDLGRTPGEHARTRGAHVEGSTPPAAAPPCRRQLALTRHAQQVQGRPAGRWLARVATRRQELCAAQCERSRGPGPVEAMVRSWERSQARRVSRRRSGPGASSGFAHHSRGSRPRAAWRGAPSAWFSALSPQRWARRPAVGRGARGAGKRPARCECEQGAERAQ